MTDHAHELRRYARKIGHPAGDVPAVMLAAADEIERLRAKIEEMERQAPVAWARKIGLDVPSFGCVTDLKYRPSDIPESSYIPLYTNPGAQPAPSVPEGWKPVPIEVIYLYSFMCAAFVPMTPQQEEIALQLDLAKRAMLAAAPEAKP